ncbi:unnamed protein product [Phyllotreta striolata]|uniref:Zinc finger CCCH-type with G patch domain-containing protein n=1 Tax=Phyllotreta striolata TaxID=444603 RepID=A0A9N9TFN5_PHYSR|nr:unnamed protein product [Phyllotreta striolata]
MNIEDLNSYQLQLNHIKEALQVCPEGKEKDELINLKSNIEQLLELTKNEADNNSDDLADEYAIFMAEMAKEGALETKKESAHKDLEGKKCRAPHKHQWGTEVYHNAIISSVIETENEDLKVKVLYINPTHKEMLPCPYLFESDCKFSDEQCRFSHGEILPYSSLQEYTQPNFELLSKGSPVLAKQPDNLWYRAKISNIFDAKCTVKFECDSKELELDLEHVLPLENDSESSEEDIESEYEELVSQEDIINNSLLITPESTMLGDWEKYTKGMGSKMMLKMGYVIGTGLGKNAEGRINPVSAVIFPAGKSLDHCMNLREQAGGDRDLFSVERKMKRQQKKREMQRKKFYERESQKQDVFTIINGAFQGRTTDKTRPKRENLKEETSRNLNIKSLQIEKDIKDAERDLIGLTRSLERHKDVASEVYKNLKQKYLKKISDINDYKQQARNVKFEQNLRDDKKKMTIF